MEGQGANRDTPVGLQRGVRNNMEVGPLGDLKAESQALVEGRESGEDTSSEKPSSLWKQFSLKINSFTAQLHRTSCPLRMCLGWGGDTVGIEWGGRLESHRDGSKGGAYRLQGGDNQDFLLSSLQPWWLAKVSPFCCLLCSALLQKPPPISPSRVGCRCQTVGAWEDGSDGVPAGFPLA